MRTIDILIPAFLLISALAKGQTPAEGTDFDFRGRASVGMDWKISKGLHFEAGYELRCSDACSRIERHQFNAGISYAPFDYIKLGTEYYYIGNYGSEKNFRPQHRICLDITSQYKFSAWKLSLRERIQLTHKSYEFNVYQKTPNLVELKSRLKLSYRGFVHLEPYAFAELRNCFNGPSFTADYDESSGKYSNYKFTGYSDAYINRIRGALGVEWKVNKRHSIDFKLMTDYCRNKTIDTNAEGTKLKSFCWEQDLNTSLCVGYVCSF